MKVDQYAGICFSPTGTTKKITAAVLSGLGPGCCTDVTTQSIPVSFSSQTCVVVGVPVFSGRVPPMAAERLSLLQGNSTPAIAIVVYGNRAYDDALLELKTILEKQGFIVASAGAFVAQHSVVPAIASGRPNQQDISRAKEFGAQSRRKLAALDTIPGLNVPGHNPYRTYKPIPFHPMATGSCSSCGLCAKSCPAGAIPLDAPNRTDCDICISCMHCVAICPLSARRLSGLQRKLAQFKLAKECKNSKQPETYL